MITLFFFALIFTILVSAICSILEAMLLGTTPVDIERLSQSHPKRSKLLEKYFSNIEETSSAILSLNTIANTLGATLVGGLGVQLWPEDPNILLKFPVLWPLLYFFSQRSFPKMSALYIAQSSFLICLIF